MSLCISLGKTGGTSVFASFRSFRRMQQVFLFQPGGSFSALFYLAWRLGRYLVVHLCTSGTIIVFLFRVCCLFGFRGRNRGLGIGRRSSNRAEGESRTREVLVFDSL